MTAVQSEPVGLVLGGGGARGAYQMGAWRAMREEGIRFAGVAGTSVGAINGALIAQGDYDRAVEAWSVLDMSKVIKINSGRSLSFHENTVDPWSLIAMLLAERKLDISPLREMLSMYIDERRVRESDMQYVLCTVSLRRRKLLTLGKEDIPQGRLVEYILASSALPLLFACKVDGEPFWDGGLIDNLPVSALLDRGLKKLYAVDIAWHGLSSQRALTPDEQVIAIRPNTRLGSILQFDAQACRHHMECGYLDARRSLGKTSGYRYYLLPGPVLPERLCEQRALADCLDKLRKKPWTSTVCRHMMPLLRKYGGQRFLWPPDDQSLTLYGAFLEIVAQCMGVTTTGECDMEALRAQVFEAYEGGGISVEPLFLLFDALFGKSDKAIEPASGEKSDALTQSLGAAVKAGGAALRRLGLTKLLLCAVFFYCADSPPANGMRWA